MIKLAFWMALATVTLTSQNSLARECNFNEGEDRWTIKTSVPDGALDREVQDVSLQSLIDSPNPQLSASQKKALAERLWTGRMTVSDANGDDISLKEGEIISVEGFLYRARCQNDGDYHLEIGVTDKKGSHCLIVEAPDPDEIKGNTDLKARVTQARQKLEALPAGLFSGAPSFKPVSVKITGQFFVDSHHIGTTNPGGNRGTNHCATNVLEIHPVTGIEIRNQ